MKIIKKIYKKKMKQSSKSLNSNNCEIERKNSNNSIIISRTNTRSFSASDSSIPKNFVPILKPKEIIFGDEEEIIPFSLYLSNNESSDEKETLDSFSSIDFSSDEENDIIIDKKPVIKNNNKKICINTILSKLTKKKNY